MSEGHRLDKKVDHSYEELKALLLASDRDFDMEKIDKAYQFALESHGDQKRRSGVPYILHPVSVAYILVELGMDTESIVASLLHDVVEDTPVGLEEIKKLFGIEVANLTDGVTKLGRIPYSSREEQQAENLRKMLIAMADDIRVIIIKLADRLHNMRTIEFMPDQKRRDKALETMEVYAPIAHRLGIRALKEEMEDISLRYLDPIGYHEIESALAMKSGEREEFINKIKKQIYDRVSSVIPNVHLEGRVKSINGIYRKVFVQGKSMEEIYDIYAVRVIVDSLNDCYNVLGMIHDMYRPIPNRFKDYISTPKPNLYQSLHTTVLGKEGVPFEVQIRTWEMHHTAEYGIAAHWKYKLGLTKSDSFEQRLMWVRQMLENQQDTVDSTELVRTSKTDLAPEEVFVFTPKGDVISLPIGSTVIDFAYAIHSAVGNRMIGAKVDGRIVPIDYKVKTGEIIDVLTTKEESHGPSRDWLKIVKTSEARNKIRQWFKKEKREENIIEGKAEVTIKNSQFALFQGDFIFIPPHVQYMITSVPESICICFNLKRSFVTAQYSDIFHDDKRLTTFLMDSLNENNQMNYLIIRTNANEIIKDLALNCFAEYINQNKYSNNIMKNCLSLIFTYVLRDENTQIESSIRVSQNDLQYQRIIDYLKQNYQFASLNSTAEYVHYTKQYVCKIVKEATGKTFNTVLIEIRLAIVCQYLENSDFSLEYISELCGFSVSSHLSRVFKEHYGMTPSAYRKAHNPH